jgi:tetratricopeptide (TPR) repeat protein
MWFDVARKRLPTPAGLTILVLVGFTLAIYGRVATFEVLSWDDDIHLTQNPYFNPVTPASVGHFWVAPFDHLYIPVSYTLFALETVVARALGGTDGTLNAAVFHLTSIALHLACVLLVFVLLRRLVGDNYGAYLGAMLFSLHPLAVESVAWVSEQRGLLSTLFSLVAIGSYVRFVDSERKAPRWFVLATIAFLLAMLAKPTAVVLPLVVLVIDYCLLSTSSGSSRRYLPLAIWLMLAAAVGIGTKFLQADAELASVPPLWQRPFIAGDALAFYLGKLVVPIGLTFDYGRTPEAVLQGGWCYVAWLIPGVILIVICRMKDHEPWLAAFGIFVAGLLPTLGLVPFLFQEVSTVADRYMYLPMLGASLAVATVAARHQSGRAFVVFSLFIGLLSAACFQQTRLWENNETLYTIGLERNPHSYLCHFGLANEALKNTRFYEAEGHFRHAIDIHPRYLPAYNNLGQMYLKQLRPAEAIEEFQKALAIKPDYVEAIVHRADAFAMQGKTGEALAEYERALAIDPESAAGHANFGSALLRAGRTEEAESHLRRALELAPKLAEVHCAVGQLLFSRNRTTDAILEFRSAIRLNPKLIEPRMDLGTALLKQQRYGEAIAEFDAALAIRPEFYQARFNKGFALVEQGKIPEGLEQFQLALRDAPPGSPEARQIEAEIENCRRRPGAKP